MRCHAVCETPFANDERVGCCYLLCTEDRCSYGVDVGFQLKSFISEQSQQRGHTAQLAKADGCAKKPSNPAELEFWMCVNCQLPWRMACSRVFRRGSGAVLSGAGTVTRSTLLLQLLPCVHDQHGLFPLNAVCTCQNLTAAEASI